MKGGNPQKAEEIFQRMKKDCCEPCVDTLIWKGVFNFIHHHFFCKYLFIHHQFESLAFLDILYHRRCCFPQFSSIGGEASSFQIYILTQFEMCFGI